MSIHVTKWVWKSSQSRNAQRLVLLAIADNASNDGGGAWPSNAEIAEKTMLSMRAVQEALRGLELLGELKVDYQAGPKGCNLYTVLMSSPPADSAPPPPADSAPPQILHPADPAPRGADPAPTPADSAPVTIKNHPEPSIEASAVADATPRDDVARLCRHLADRIESNGSKRPTISKRWHDSARLILDRDGRTEQQVHTAIEWCQNDEFWKTNILSMPKLRDKYDQLRLQAQRSQTRRRPNDDIDWDAAMQRAQARETQEDQ